MSGHLLAGRYRLVERRASGGMAQVWVADDQVLGRQVAAKVLHAHLAADERFVRRFRAEAVAAARLAHPNIVAIYDTVSEGGIEAIIMELIDGITLRQYLDRFGSLNVPDTLDVIDGIARALDAAHRGGIVHRDVKPANILLCADRRVKVTDFGIAKASEDSDLTQQGTLLGTAKYLAPEQLEGKAVDARTDVYSLGTVTYECLCGRAPFDEGSDTATALARLHREPPPLRTFQPGLSDAVDLAVRRSLARHPDLRPASAGGFVELLRVSADAPAPPSAGLAPRVVATTASTYSTTPGGPTTAPTVALRQVDPEPTLVELDPRLRAGVRQIDEDEPRSGRWVRPLIVLAIVAACVGLGLALLNDGDPNTPNDVGTDATGTDAPVETEVPADGATAVAFDFDPPPGDGREHPDETGFIVDDDPSTGWSTETYQTPNFGGLKTGVGVVLQLDGRRALDLVQIFSSTAGWSGEVYVADAPAASLADWGSPVATIDGASGDPSRAIEFELDGREGGALLLWITDLAGTSVRITELVVSD